MEIIENQVQNKSKTNYECVKQFHKVFGHPCPEILQKNVLKENPKLVQFRLSLIEEEFNELKKAVNENNLNNVIDALADILYVVYGMGVAFGIDLDKAFKIVHESNMSKLCSNKIEALETIKNYKNLPEFANVNVGFRPSSDNKYFVVYNTDTGKILKSKFFTSPNFEELLK